MNIQLNFEELLKLLEIHDVDYMIIGGYAVAFHGYPRFTQDIDIFYNNNTQNIIRLRDALKDFGFSDSDIPENVFQEEGNIIQFGITPVRIDLLNKISGISFKDAKESIMRGKYGDTEVNFIGKNELIVNKNATERLKDKVDVQELGR